MAKRKKRGEKKTQKTAAACAGAAACCCGCFRKHCLRTKGTICILLSRFLWRGIAICLVQMNAWCDATDGRHQCTHTGEEQRSVCTRCFSGSPLVLFPRWPKPIGSFASDPLRRGHRRIASSTRCFSSTSRRSPRAGGASGRQCTVREGFRDERSS